MISELANEFYSEWFANPSWWFNATLEDDCYISKKYSILLDQEYNLHSLKLDEKITIILIKDQLARHVFRNCTSIIDTYLTDALVCTHSLSNNDLNRLQSKEVLFALLPLRHTNIHANICIALVKVWAILQLRPNDVFLKKFIKASYKRMPMNQSALVTSNNDGCQMPTCNIVDLFKTVLDTNSYVPKDNYESKHLVNKVVQVLQRLGADTQTIVISLSGGVDSMVLCYILNQLKTRKFFTNLVAVHIDYANRCESYEEAKFVMSWCKANDLVCICRRLDEINRSNCMHHGLRSIYEEYTRNVRFNTYKVVATKPIVFLGHNTNDCFENILTNIAKKTKYDNLTGMDTISVQDDIVFCRPLLSASKKELYEYAASNNIPFLNDSTVSWSQRGKIRDTVVPTLSAWDEQFIPSTFYLSTNLTQMYQVLDDIVELYCSKTSMSPHPLLTISTSCHVIQNTLFWRKYIYKLFNIQLSSASLECFVTGISRFCVKGYPTRKFILSKILYVEGHQLKDYILFKWLKYKKVSTTIE